MTLAGNVGESCINWMENLKLGGKVCAVLEFQFPFALCCGMTLEIDEIILG